MKNKKMLLIASYVVGSSIVTIFQRYLTFHFDNFTQNFYRFLSGSLSLSLFCFFLYPEDLKMILKKASSVFKIAILAGLATAAQLTFVEGISHTSATVAGFISAFAVPLTVVLAILIFPEEKEVARGKSFLPGFLLVFGGTFGFILSKGSLSLEYSMGTLLLILSTFIGVFVVLLQKKLVINLNPVCISAIMTAFMCLFFFIGGLIWGNLSRVASVSFFTNFILFASGVFGLVAGINLHLVNIKISGILITKIAELTVPVLILLFAFIFLKESLGNLQIIFGTIIIAGSLVTVLMSAKKKSLKFE